jgi:cysteinyl-tRNA synthetase
MSAAYLGEVFDIHGGGLDLIFPHHENEIAQSRCAHGTHVMANYWMHNGFLQVEGEKMSKSLGNFVTIRELLATKTFGDRLWPGEVLRWAMLMTHYREPINWSVDRLTEARRELADFVESVVESPSNPYPIDIDDTDLPNSVVSALCDDLNTHAARTHLQLLHKQAVRGDQDAKRFLCRALVWLGIFRPAFNDAYSVSSSLASGKAWSGGYAPTYALIEKYREAMLDARAIVLNEYEWDTREHGRRLESRKKVEARINTLDARMPEDGVALELSEHSTVSLVPMRPETAVSKARVDELVAARNAARKARDFKEADRIRDDLSAMGIQLKDAKDPATGEIVTTWEVKR